MAAGDTPITIVGNLVNDPELRFTASGQPVATFRVASTPRIRDNSTGEWKDGDSLFLTCNVWRQMAENCAESLQRGMRVIVSGRLRQRNYETQQGEKRTVYEIEADDVGPSLLRASAKVTRATRAGGDGGFGGGPSSGGNSSGGSPAGGSPAGGSPAGGGASGGNYGGGQRGGNGNSGGGARSAEPDPWASDSGGYSDEPPF
ncbi:MAG: ssb1 [Actinomycetia bacterium]|nr:ssb1 [Actinomycetes bacterium]